MPLPGGPQNDTTCKLSLVLKICQLKCKFKSFLTIQWSNDISLNTEYLCGVCECGVPSYERLQACTWNAYMNVSGQPHAYLLFPSYLRQGFFRALLLHTAGALASGILLSRPSIFPSERWDLMSPTGTQTLEMWARVLTLMQQTHFAIQALSLAPY